MKRRAERGEFGFEPPDTGAEDQPALREVLQCRQFFGERQWVAHRQDQHAGAEPHPLGHRRGPGQAQHRVVKQWRARKAGAWHDDVLTDPDIVETQILCSHRRAADLVRCRLLAGMRQMNPELHCPSSRARL